MRIAREAQHNQPSRPAATELTVDAAHRIRFARRFAWAGAVVSAVFGTFYQLSFHFNLGFVVFSCGTIACVAAAAALRRARSVNVAAHLLAAVVFGLTCFISYVRTDLPVPALMFAATVPLLMAYLVGKRAAWLWAALTALAAVFFYVRLAGGYSHAIIPTPPLAQRRIADTMALVALIVLLLQLALSVDAARRAAAREREQVLRDLQRARRLESVGLLAAGVAHEINNPLSFIIINLEVVLKQLTATGATPEQITGPMRDALEGARRVGNIVTQLGRFSRMSDGPDQVLDLGQVVDTAVDLARQQLDERAQLVKTYTPGIYVRADAGRLCQVFLNILDNAAHAICPGAAEHNEIRLQTGVSDGWAAVAIEDTGSGIAPENEDRVFDPFFTTRPVGQGAGLGLSISHSIVTAVGGHIDIATQSGRGTRVTVRLPCVAADAPHAVSPGR